MKIKKIQLFLMLIFLSCYACWQIAFYLAWFFSDLYSILYTGIQLILVTYVLFWYVSEVDKDLK